MKAPFYSVVLNNNAKTVLSDRIDSFRFEDCTEQDDLLEVQFSPLNLNQINFEEDLITGVTIQFMFGYLGQSNSGFRSARITDIEAQYAQQIRLKIRALDIGTVIKRTSDNKVWQNITSGNIVRQIAAKYNLQPIIEAEGQTWTNLPQANKSDFELLKQIAQEDGSGDFICYVSNNELRFVRRSLLSPSVRTFVYGDPESGVISFSPKNNESTALNSGIKSTGVSVNPFTGASETNTTDRTDGDMLGKFVNLYDANAEKIGQQVADIGKKVVVPAADAANQNKLKQQTKVGALNAETATLVIEGDVTIKSNQVITMNGVLRRHRGNWWVTKVVHEISSAGYITTLELSKNASRTGTVTPPGSINNSIGVETGQPRRTQVVVYDANAERIVQ